MDAAASVFVSTLILNEGVMLGWQSLRELSDEGLHQSELSHMVEDVLVV